MVRNIQKWTVIKVCVQSHRLNMFIKITELKDLVISYLRIHPMANLQKHRLYRQTLISLIAIRHIMSTKVLVK